MTTTMNFGQLNRIAEENLLHKMKKEWKKVTLKGELVDLSMLVRGSIDLANLQFNITEKQQLTLLAKYKLSTIIKFKIKLFLQRVINWIMNVSDERVKPFNVKQELKQAKRYFKE